MLSIPAINVPSVTTPLDRKLMINFHKDDKLIQSHTYPILCFLFLAPRHAFPTSLTVIHFIFVKTWYKYQWSNTWRLLCSPARWEQLKWNAPVSSPSPHSHYHTAATSLSNSLILLSGGSQRHHFCGKMATCFSFTANPAMNSSLPPVDTVKHTYWPRHHQKYDMFL